MQRRASVLALALAISAPAWSCDLCAVYLESQAHGDAEGFYAAIAQQYTRYDQLRQQGHRLDDDSDQFLDSSVTQLIAGYGFSPDVSVQLGVPLIQRWYKRPAHDGNDAGMESGLGDLNLVARYMAYRRQAETRTLLAGVQAGLELPTGDSDRLAEELHDHQHEGRPNGIHGHDLALGSGSIDLLFGGFTLARLGRWLGNADVQYALRRRGDFDYRFGDDLQWTLGLGRYLLLDDSQTLTLQAFAEGEYKRHDDLGGERLDDTHSGGVMLGPRLQWTYEGRYSVDARGLAPLQAFNTEIQTTAAYRLRLALGFRF